MASSQRHSFTAPLHYWSIFRHKLLWAYDGVLRPAFKRWPYIPSPTPAWLLREGSVTLQFVDGEEHYQAGDWIFPREKEAMQTFSSGASLLSIRFQAEWCYGVPILSREKSIAFPSSQEPALTRHAEALTRFIKRHFPDARSSSVLLNGDFEFYLELQPLLMQWISSYYRVLTARGVEPTGIQELDPRVLKALYVIEDQPLSYPFDSAEIAHKAGCSISQLNKLFQRQIGATPSMLWGRRRLMAAKSELLGAGEGVKTIAFNLGFSSPEHFATWFRKKTGVAPRQFRAAAKAEGSQG